MSTPDLTGFREAMRAKRAAFGEPVTFHWPDEQTWPADAKIDPETGRPHDPLVQPTTSDPREVTIQAEIASSPGRKDGDDPTQIGSFEVGDVLVVLDLENEDQVDGATEFVVRDERFVVRATRQDGLVGADRFLVFGERMS